MADYIFGIKDRIEIPSILRRFLLLVTCRENTGVFKEL